MYVVSVGMKLRRRADRLDETESFIMHPWFEFAFALRTLAYCLITGQIFQSIY